MNDDFRASDVGGVTDAMVEAARTALVRVDSVYLPAKIVRRALEAALEAESEEGDGDV